MSVCQNDYQVIVKKHDQRNFWAGKYLETIQFNVCAQFFHLKTDFYAYLFVCGFPQFDR